MKKKNTKKIILLYVLDALEKGSSKEKPISVLGITRALNSIGVECERRTISRNVDYLIEYGKPIVKLGRGKIYYDHEKDLIKK